MDLITAAIGLGILALIALVFIIMVFYRVVVTTNEVHIVQSGKKTVSYGKDQKDGNVYYKWPACIPIFGVTTIKLPVSVFCIELKDYAAYDKGRVPFTIDIMAFFRINDSNLAAQRVKTTEELNTQLKGILQGACRSILASSEIEEILEGRSKFGVMFTTAVDEQLKSWGVSDVKNIELMDIRDATGSSVIAAIMAKKKSLIEKESRIAVAENTRAAQEAEVVAQRQVELAKQEAQETVGRREADKNKAVGIANQVAQQEVKAQEKVTQEKAMAVTQVTTVRAAEIAAEVKVVNANQEKQTAIIAAERDQRTTVIAAEAAKQTAVVRAEGEKAQTVLIAEGEKGRTVALAEGNLTQAQLNAKGIEAVGVAKGIAEQAVLMAPVNTQITLAKEIGTNEGYQTYLIRVKQIDAGQVVGVAQADALKAAQIKVIANSGDVVSGVSGVMGLLTPQGGTQIGGMLEALAQTDAGKAVLGAVTTAATKK